MKKRLLPAIMGLGLAGALIAPSFAADALAGHPNLRAARSAVDQALAACRRAHASEKHGEFGGHRDKAEQLLEQAKAELDQAAAFANTHR